MSDIDNNYLEIVYIDIEDDVSFDARLTETEIPILELDYYEWHAITEALKMAQNWIHSKIALQEEYGWEAPNVSPINKVSRTSIRTALDKAHHVRRYMAARYQGVSKEEAPQWDREIEHAPEKDEYAERSSTTNS